MNINKLKRFVLLVGDTLLLYLSLYLTLLLRYGSNFSMTTWQAHIIPFTLLFIIWIVIFFINNLYTVQLVKNDFKFYSYLVQNLLINTLVGFTFFYLAPGTFTSLRPFRVLIILVVIYAVLFILWRSIFYRLTTSDKLANNVLFVGINNEALELIEEIKKNKQFGYKVAAIIADEVTDIPALQGVHRSKDLTQLQRTIQEHAVQTIVMVGGSKNDAEVSRYLFETLHLGLTYFSFPDFFERLIGKIPVGSLEKSWFLENLLEGKKVWYEFVKRIEDIFFSVMCGALSLLLIPFIIGAIKITSPGSILFKQVRTGKGGRAFTAMKFRTMIPHAETQGPQWATKDDKRVTRIGKILRKTRLDEIPQFINILKGDMSFVGPRPERPEFVSMLSATIPFYKERLLVKPGLSGWAQINYKYGESVEDAMAKLQYDLFYIKNRSFALDLSIILKTVSIVTRGTLGQ